MTKTVDDRLSLLEMMSSDTGQIVIVINMLEESISYVSPDGDHHLLSEAEYQMMKDKDNITSIY